MIHIIISEKLVRQGIWVLAILAGATDWMSVLVSPWKYSVITFQHE